jgi:hypothetical protein
VGENPRVQRKLQGSLKGEQDPDTPGTALSSLPRDQFQLGFIGIIWCPYIPPISFLQGSLLSIGPGSTDVIRVVTSQHQVCKDSLRGLSGLKDI